MSSRLAFSRTRCIITTLALLLVSVLGGCQSDSQEENNPKNANTNEKAVSKSKLVGVWGGIFDGLQLEFLESGTIISRFTPSKGCINFSDLQGEYVGDYQIIDNDRVRISWSNTSQAVADLFGELLYITHLSGSRMTLEFSVGGPSERYMIRFLKEDVVSATSLENVAGDSWKSYTRRQWIEQQNQYYMTFLESGWLYSAGSDWSRVARWRILNEDTIRFREEHDSIIDRRTCLSDDGKFLAFSDSEKLSRTQTQQLSQPPKSLDEPHYFAITIHANEENFAKKLSTVRKLVSFQESINGIEAISGSVSIASLALYGYAQQQQKIVIDKGSLVYDSSHIEKSVRDWLNGKNDPLALVSVPDADMLNYVFMGGAADFVPWAPTIDKDRDFSSTIVAFQNTESLTPSILNKLESELKHYFGKYSWTWSCIRCRGWSQIESLASTLVK